MALAILTLISCSFVPTLLPRPASGSRRASAAVVMLTKDAPVAETWQLTTDGLKFVDEEIGNGPDLAPSSVISVHYTVSFAVSGELLGTTKGKWPLTFAPNKHDVPLFSDAVQGMRVGGKRRLAVPASKIPPSQVQNVPQDNYAEGLRVEIELESIESGAKALIPSLLPPGNRRVTIARALFALSFLPYLLPAELQPPWYQGGDPALIAQAHQVSNMMGGASLDLNQLFP